MRFPALLLAAVLATLTTACGDDTSNASAQREANEDEARVRAREQEREERARERTAAEGAAARERAAAAAAASPPRPTRMLLDSDAIALMILVDEHEVAAAKLAQERTQNVLLKEFAKAMETEHAADRTEARKLEKSSGPITDPDAVRALRESNAAALQRLQDTPEGLGFDALYIETRQEAFTAATTMIDEKLAPGARITEVKDYLARAKAALADRQARAQATQLEL